MYYVKKEILEAFVRDVFRSLDINEADAKQAAEVVVHSDYSGVESHGLARLPILPIAGHKGYGLASDGDSIETLFNRYA